MECRSLQHAIQITGLVLTLCGGTPADAAGIWDSRGVRVIQSVDMRYPPSLLLEGTTSGQVRVVMDVDETGKLRDFLITGFTHPALGAELQRELANFDFEPAIERGEPIRVRFEVIFDFEARGAVLSLNGTNSVSAQLRQSLGNPMTHLLARESELDRPIKVLQQVAPVHPRRRGKPGAPGTAQIDFYIDSNGRPRMPVVVRASAEEFGAAAIDALVQWQFAPPTRDGRPTYIRVVQEFVFAAPPQ